jgi:hypothetical protein
VSILLTIYLAGFFTTAGYGAGVCYTEDNHAIGPEICTVATTAAAVAWPITVPMAMGKK